MGDINKNGNLDIGDATILQSYLARQIDINDPAFDFSHADLSNDGKLTVLDATLIQIAIAKGEAPVVPTDPTEETTEPSEETTEPTEPTTDPTEETTESTEPTTDPTEETTDEDYELPFVPAD